MMNRYPRNPWAPALAFAAVVATIVTMAIAVVLPAKMDVQPAVDTAVLAKRDARPAGAIVELGRIDVVVPPTAVTSESSATAVPTALNGDNPG